MANRANFAGNVTNMTQTLSHGSTAFQEQKRQSEYKSADRRLINKIAKDNKLSNKGAKEFKESTETDKRYSDLMNTTLSNARDEGRRSATNIGEEKMLGEKEKKSEKYKINEATAQQVAQGKAGEYGKARGKINKYNTEETLAEERLQGDANKYGALRGGINKYNAKETYEEQRNQGNALEYGSERGKINKYNAEETEAQNTAQGEAKSYGKKKGEEGKEQRDFELGRRLSKGENASYIAGMVQGEKEERDTKIQDYKNKINASENNDLFDIANSEVEEEVANRAYKEGYRERQIDPKQAGAIQADTDFNKKIYQSRMNEYNRVIPDTRAAIDSRDDYIKYARKMGEQKVDNPSVEYASGAYNKIGQYAKNIEDLATFMDYVGSPQGPMIANYMRTYGDYFDAFRALREDKSKKDKGE